MDVSIFLAKLFGLYFLITGPYMILKRDTIKGVFTDYFEHPSIVVVNGALSLITGLLIVLFHNVWELSYKILITLFGYLSIVRGVIHLYLPDRAHNMAEKMSSGNALLISGFVFTLIGIYLTWVGFAAA